MIARTAYRLAFVVARAVLDTGTERSDGEALMGADNGLGTRGEDKLAVGRCCPLRREDRADQTPKVSRDHQDPAAQERARDG